MRFAKHAIVAYVKTALFSKVKDGLPFCVQICVCPPSVVQAAMHMLEPTSVTRFLHHAHLPSTPPPPKSPLTPNTIFLLNIFNVNTVCFISIHVQFIFFYFVLWPTNAQLFHKLSHSYMFRHYSVIIRVLVINDRLCGLWSEFLATDTEVPGSIPGATRFS